MLDKERPALLKWTRQSANIRPTSGRPAYERTPSPPPAKHRGKWSQPGVPQKGWQCIDIDDLEEIAATCEMCETQEIRFVHNMEHPNYPHVLGVGCVCAEHMEGDYVAAKQREKRAISIAGRRARWMKGPVERIPQGNPFINRNGFNVVLYPYAGGWAYKVEDGDSGQLSRGSGYGTLDEVKLAAFEKFIELGG